MKKICVLSILFLFITSSALADISKSLLLKSNSIDPTKEKEIKTRIGTLQIPFIKNESQISNNKVKYYANTFAGTIFVTDNEIVYGLKGWAVKEKFVNAKKTKAEGINAAETKVNYFKGSNSSNWKSNIPTYQEIGFGEVYKNIRLSLKAYGKNVEKLFIVEKGGKPEDISIKVEGAKGLKVSEKGELEIETGKGIVTMTRPVAYQEINGNRIEVPVKYTHKPQTKLIYGFTLGSYDRTRELVIDPLLASTFVGGDGPEGGDFYAPDPIASAIDSYGNVYVAGYTGSSDFPTLSGSYDRGWNVNIDGFIAKLDAGLITLLSSSYLGGHESDSISSLTIDSSGNVYVVGTTSSSEFPTTNGAYDRVFGISDSCVAFISKLDSNLTTLIASTYLGSYASATSIALDTSGNVYVTGNTESAGFPTTDGAYDRSFLGIKAFISKFDVGLTTLLASTFLGGTHELTGGGGFTWSWTITIDSSNNVYVAGNTSTSDFPTTEGAYDRNYNGGRSDAFISKFNPDLTVLISSTYLGGSAEYGEYVASITVDSSNNIYVTGLTFSIDFPTTPGAYDTTLNPWGNDYTYGAFISHLDNNLTTLLASTFLGGEVGGTRAFSLAIDRSGNVFVAGCSYYPGYRPFPTTSDAYDTTFNGGEYEYDPIISKFDAGLTTLLASTYLGLGYAYSINTDLTGNVYVAGATYSQNFPTTEGTYDRSFNGGGYDAFISKLDSNLASGTPTLINLSSFFCTSSNRYIIIDWTTESEIDNAGFNLYRSESEDGEYVKINPSLIPTKGSSTQGASYQFVDDNVKNRNTYYYKLEDIDLSGNSTFHGPVNATPRMIYEINR